MLAAFIAANRDAIIGRVRARVAARVAPKPLDGELSGIPVFLDQLCDALRLAKASDQIDHKRISETAAQHGHDLLRMGVSIGQAVHDYGDICQTVTELCDEQAAPIPPGEFKTLNLCLYDAIAEAVSEYARQRERDVTAHGRERLGTLAHEMRNLLSTAVLSFDSIRSGLVAPSGATGQVHARALIGLRDLIERSLADVRLDAAIEHRENISVADLIEDVEVGASIQALGRAVQFQVDAADRTSMIEGDRQILAAALSNLVQNALKFTRERGTVVLKVSTTADRVHFEVQDQCGGLAEESTEDLFCPFQQRGPDRRGTGLGLSICRKAARAHAGEIYIRNMPGEGCVFTLDLPRKPEPAPIA